MVADRSMLVQAAAAAAGGQQYPAPALYVVATPIGNLADLSLRALHVLAIGRRDRLRGHPAQRPPARALRPEPAAARRPRAQRARRGRARCSPGWPRGERVAYVSDAGTPAVSDPGAALVAAVRDAGFRVVPIPGASSALAALSVAGDTERERLRRRRLPAGTRRRARSGAGAVRRGGADPGAVRGAAPHRGARRRARRGLPAARRSPSAASSPSSSRPSPPCRPSDLPAWLAADPNRARGEFALVLHALAGSGRRRRRSRSRCAARAAAARALPLKQAVTLAAEIGGAPRNVLYARASS